MKRKERVLWPSTSSKFFRRHQINTEHCSPCVTRPSDILLHGSDSGDILDNARLEKIHRLAQQYLSGGQLFIPSAISWQRFEHASTDEHTDYAADHATTTLDTGLLPARPTEEQLNDSVDVARGISPVPATPHNAATETAASPDPRFDELFAGIAQAKRLSMSALRAIPAEDTVIDESSAFLETRQTSPAPASLDAQRLTLFSEAARPVRLADSSPFVYRKGKLRKPSRALRNGGRPSYTPAAAPAHEVSPVANGASLQARTPAIDGRNARLSLLGFESESPRTVKARLREEMRAAGATFEQNSQTTPEQMARSPLRSRTPNSATTRTLSPTKPLHEQTEPLSYLTPMQLSTQAALQAAHAELIRQSPADVPVSPARLSAKPPSTELSRSPGSPFVPFARFHERMNLERSTPQMQPSTQHMMNAFSPFQISPSRTQNGQTPDTMPDAVPVPQQQPGLSLAGTSAVSTARAGNVDWGFSVLDDAPVQPSPPRLQFGPEIVPSTYPQMSIGGIASPPLSTAGGEAEMQRNVNDKVTRLQSPEPVTSQHTIAPGLKGMGFKVSKPRRASGSFDDQPKLKKQRRSSQLAKPDKSAARAPSFSLSQIMIDLSQSGLDTSDLDQRRIAEAIRPSQTTPGRNARRGQVVDWPSSSPPVTKLPAMPEQQSNVSRARDSFINGARDANAEPLPEYASGESPMTARARLTFNDRFDSAPSHTPTNADASAAKSSAPRSALKSALRKTQQSSHQDAQREPDMLDIDLDHSLTEFGRSMLGTWDLDSELRMQ